MKIPEIVIAIDGFSSTGKSTFAKLVAKEFSFLYLDSGAMYRAVTLFAQENGFISQSSEVSPSLEGALAGLDLHFDTGGRTCIGERVVEKEIRTMAVSSQVSAISAVAFVREFVDGRLHSQARGRGVVMDGRDIGTTVFPDAGIKIFMVASEQVRARRRFEELAAKGESPRFDDVLKNIRERDYLDSHREISPLRKAQDAFVLDNSEMTLKEELVWIRGLAQGKYGILQ